MIVTRVLVNKGETRRETGFLNPELQQRLGLVDMGPGRLFCYAFQVTFQLLDMSPEDLVLRRQFHEKTYKNEAWSPPPVPNYELKSLRDQEGWPDEETPNEHDVKREGRRLVIQAGPMPKVHFNERQIYPVAYEGRFRLKAENKTGDLLASSTHYVRLLKRAWDGQLEGEFEELESKTLEPRLEPAARMTVASWVQNWDLCRQPCCQLPGRLPMQTDRATLRHWLYSFLGDSFKISQMRQFLWIGGTGPDAHRYPDEVVIDLIIEQLWSGRVHAHSRYRTFSPQPDRRGQSTVYTERDFGNEYTPFPLSERKPRAAGGSGSSSYFGAAPEPATFSPQTRMDQQAATLVAAASAGAPCVLL